MKKSAVVQAFVSKEYVKGLTADKAQSEREILLAGLRTKFGEHDIFVESVTWTNDRTELHKGNREVRGAKYRKLFDTVVQVWVNNL
ncbi:hypothetical protein JCM19235_1295 [Vibrio maritimus]|uniref:Uncharacterized protein n=1 Tax=Vibrio maritimus TaxID=990268 RepID=A0A090S928_9VIBR|nr:hypothetical protein JCM19235_1295 [Vibrio maritimus]